VSTTRPIPPARRSSAGGRRVLAVLGVVAACAGCAGTDVRAPAASRGGATIGAPAPEARTTEAIRRGSAPASASASASASGPSPDAGRLAPVDGRRLVDALRAGSHVLYFRHTRTHRDQIGFERDMLASGRLRVGQCDTQRNLNEDGLRDARRQAEALAALRVAPGPVVASRYCRAWQHAMQVAGRVDAYDDVLTPPRDAGKVASLRALLARPPAPGTNTWVFAHGGVLWGATNYDSVESETFVFAPDGPDRPARLVASIRIEEWEALRAGRPCCAPRIGWQGRSAPPE
jgi:hypothetical protein